MRRWLIMITLAVAAGLLTGGIDPNEFECEEAVARLEQCCDGDYTGIGCGGGCDSVDIGIETATTIRNSSCEELHIHNYCTSYGR